jgi:hypothetical protein
LYLQKDSLYSCYLRYLIFGVVCRVTSINITVRYSDTFIALIWFFAWFIQDALFYSSLWILSLGKKKLHKNWFIKVTNNMLFYSLIYVKLILLGSSSHSPVLRTIHHSNHKKKRYPLLIFPKIIHFNTFGIIIGTFPYKATVDHIVILKTFKTYTFFATCLNYTFNLKREELLKIVEINRKPL